MMNWTSGDLNAFKAAMRRVIGCPEVAHQEGEGMIVANRFEERDLKI